MYVNQGWLLSKYLHLCTIQIIVVMERIRENLEIKQVGFILHGIFNNEQLLGDSLRVQFFRLAALVANIIQTSSMKAKSWHYTQC